MSDAQQKLETARNIYQSLPLEKQLEIKKQEPDLYHAIYGGDAIPNTYYLEPFIEKHQTGSEGEIPKDSPNANLSAEIVKGFKNAKFSRVPASIVEANDLFQKLSVDTQMMIKKDKPEIYNMLFKENVFVDTSTLSAFLKDYDPKYLEIKSIRDLETLSLNAQLEFKNNFPGEYSKIMFIEPKATGNTIIKMSVEKKHHQIPEALQARNIFKSLPISSKEGIKSNNPELFAFLMGLSSEVDNVSLNAFLEKS